MKSFALLSVLATAALGAVMDTPSTLPAEIQDSKSSIRADAIERKIRYGPFHLDAASVDKNGQLVGTQFNQIIPNIKKPCKECYLQLITAHLEYPNGTLTVNPGTYLHHIVVANTGYGVVDGTCGTPGLDPFFSSGNEQPTEIYNTVNATVNTGYYVGKGGKFFMNAYVLNNEPIPKDFYVALTYTMVDGPHPTWDKTRVAWVSYGHTDCKTPMMNADAADVVVPNETAFTVTSDPWVSPWSGEILITGGHLHNGGLYMKIYKNDALLCDSRASYSKGSGMAMMGDRRRSIQEAEPGQVSGMIATPPDYYLSDMTSCPSPGRIEKGDKIKIEAAYNFTMHAGIKKEDGHIAPVMALAKFYIATEPTTVAAPAA